MIAFYGKRVGQEPLLNIQDTDRGVIADPALLKCHLHDVSPVGMQS